jgi:peptidoglycan/xylan/chitin deacetylase (PgdA/CDA1 family)
MPAQDMKSSNFGRILVIFLVIGISLLAWLAYQNNAKQSQLAATKKVAIGDQVAAPKAKIPTISEVRAAKKEYLVEKQQLIVKYAGQNPKHWGIRLSGVKSRIDTTEKVIALTFDACGGKGGSNYDAKLIKYLKKNKIQATFFISGKWIDKNRKTFVALSKWPGFEIENHGLKHRPLSLNGKSAYGIKGTQGISGMVQEIEENAIKIWRLTGKRPLYFRSGTAYTDEIGVKVVNDLGYEIVAFNLDADGGAKLSKKAIMKRLSWSKPGTIVLMHFNHPEGKSAEGLISMIPALKKKGFKFIRLQDEFEYLDSDQ